MPRLPIENINHEIIIHLLHIKCMFTSNEKAIEHFLHHSVELNDCIKQAKTKA
jgi:hypothetical protein